jgi:hypothetical protein
VYMRKTLSRHPIRKDGVTFAAESGLRIAERLTPWQTT